MRKKIYYYILFLFTAFVISCKDDIPDTDTPDNPDPKPTAELIFPKKEMRSVWITTAWGLDWPMGKYGIQAQKDQYIQYLDRFEELNINTVIFQVKPMGDAFYNSPYEPWSVSITGERGKDPGYDVLKFLIDEAHKRNIEFHAWMNPYRIATRASNATPYPALHPSVNPEWVVSHEKIQIYNPALPEVRQRLADIVKDLITKYNVDGIHFDDYFYPDPSSAGTMVSDAPDYQKYGAGYNSIEDFRRANVDMAIKGVHDAIVATKPGVIFTISPAASPDYNLNTLFANVRKWCQEGWLDVVMPQLYQEVGNPYNDFQERLGWWTQYSYTAAPMIGHALYKFGDGTSPSPFQSTAELQRQFDLTRKNQKVKGNAMYSARFVLFNNINITDKLADIYKNPAVIPFLGREVAPAPTKPTNVKIENGQLTWAKQGNLRSVVYYFADVKKEGVVLAITDKNSLPVTSRGSYCVTTINADNNESEPSEIVEMNN
ncbi:MAG: family 10 glycosylhydrolase [Proteiniphilum sp.]|uniref:glycoside hydrolase family 10 protein n=1 Tax=Proteiniphilum sp. TaxID=1926877 RepID=UPI002AB92952|nr:family 10 glycosylhydrolase [Proteiniphilum sp.]MDY9919329.1 family 10 glycosylhydrolase [Proteiniphilum sp.]